MITRLKALFRRNLPAKIIAFIVAIILWLFVMNEQNPQIEGTFTVPVDMVNALEGYKITQNVKNVKIKVRGARSLFVSAEASDFKAYIDLTGYNSGDYETKIQAVLPQGFELVDIQPASTAVNLDKIIQREVHIDLIVTGTASPGLTVDKISQSMNTVLIEGPESRVNEIDRAVGYVGLAGNHEDFSLQVPLTAITSDGKALDDITILPRTVRVSVQLARGLARKIVSVHPVVGGVPPEGFVLVQVQADPTKIEAAGDATVLAKLTAIDTEPLSLTDLKQSDKRTVQLVLPDGVTVSNREVVVTFELKPKEEVKEKGSS